MVKNHTFTLKFESLRSTVTNIHMYIWLYWRHSAIWFKIIEIMSNDTKCVGKANSHLILVWKHSVSLLVEKLRCNCWTSCVKLAFVCVGNRMSDATCRCHTIAFLPGVKCVEDAHPYAIILSANVTLIDLSVFVVCGFCVTTNKNKSYNYRVSSLTPNICHRQYTNNICQHCQVRGPLWFLNATRNPV